MSIVDFIVIILWLALISWKVDNIQKKLDCLIMELKERLKK